MRTPAALLVAGLLSLAVGCAPDRTEELAERATRLEELAGWLTGSFESAESGARWHLERIWPEREDGIWILGERVAAHGQPIERVVRQVIDRDVLLYELRSYDVPGAEAAPDTVVPQKDCGIVLFRTEQAYEGSVLGRLCTSGTRGAAYLNSDWRVTADAISREEHGYDAAQAELWDSSELFRRIGVPDP